MNYDMLVQGMHTTTGMGTVRVRDEWADACFGEFCAFAFGENVGALDAPESIPSGHTIAAQREFSAPSVGSVFRGKGL